MRTSATATFVAVAAGVACAPVAQADVLVSPAPGARHLAAAGGYQAWAAPRPDGRWQLMVREPGGAVARADVKTFAVAPDVALGGDGYATDRHVIAVYPRCEGRSTVKGCDVFRYDLATRKERKADLASSKSYSEVAPSIALGRIGFVRRDGTHNGVHVAVPGSEQRPAHLNRVDGHIARETAITVSRIAFLYRNSKGQDDITLGQLDGENRRLIVRSAPSVLFNVVISRYRVGWLERRAGIVARRTDRINPSDERPAIRTGNRTLPDTTDSAVVDDNLQFTQFLDAIGVHRIAPPLFR